MIHGSDKWEDDDVSGPDELLAEIREALRISAGSHAIDAILIDCYRRIAANAALAARCEKMQAAIDELFALDLYNTPVGKRMTKESEQRRLEYAKRWPLAWKTIRALASQAEGER